MQRASLVGGAVVVALALAVSAATLGFDFVLYDDDYLVYANPTVHDPGNIPSFFRPDVDRSGMGSEYLPLVTTSFALDWWLWGGSPRGFHLTNVVLYALGCLAAWAWLRALLASDAAATLGAALFAAHPVHAESFAWVAERKGLLAMLFAFGALALHERARAAGAVGYALALLSKATTVTLPAAVLARERWRGADARGALRAAAPWLALAAAATLLTLWLATRARLLRPEALPLLGRVLLDAELFTRNVQLLLVPAGHCAFLTWPVPRAPSPRALVGVVLAVTLAVAAWRARRRDPALAFAGAWFFATLLPVMNLAPKGVPLADRYLLLPSFALAIVAGRLWQRADGLFPRGRRLVRLALAALVLVFAVRCAVRALVWRDSFTLWRATLAHPDHDPQAWDHLGLAYLQLRRDPAAAASTFVQGLREVERRGAGRSSVALTLRQHRALALRAGGDAPGAREEARLAGALARDLGPRFVAEHEAFVRRWGLD